MSHASHRLRSKAHISTLLLGASLIMIAGQATARAGGERQGANATQIAAPAGGAAALVFLSTECPISNAYSSTLSELAKGFPADRFRLIGLCVDPDADDDAVRKHAAEYALSFPVRRDASQKLARKYGVTVTPEVVVLDDRGKVRYQGRIDDQFAARQKRNQNPTTHELRDAVAALLAGGEVPAPKTAAVGCPLPRSPQPEAVPTYAKEVSRIVQEHCQECHRPGQVGPFSLMSYKDAAKRAALISEVVEGRTMPPWKAVHGFGPSYKNDRSLSESEIAAITAWAEAGAPEGNPADLLPPREFSSDWALGTPDLIVELPEAYAIPAQTEDGKDIYRCFVLPTSVPEDKYISAIEYRPGNRRVVHHILSYVDTTGEARRRDEGEPGPGYSCFSGPGVENLHGDLGGWAPGNEPSRLPDGVGRSLPKGADVVMQVHYHPTGKPETDRSQIGLHFARKPIKQTLHWNGAGDFALKIPAGEPNHRAEGHWPVPVDCTTLAVSPHMHMIGHDMTMTVTLPDGTVKPLVKIDDWDFGWQNTYWFREPFDLPKGSVLHVEAHFDNSASNPRNPNKPPKEIHWGEATTDEMCIGFIALVKKGQDLTKPGEKDDLRDIFAKQRDDFRKKRAQAGRQD